MEKILIVDDSKTSRKFLRNMLTGAGYEVVAEAVDGIDGVDKLFIVNANSKVQDEEIEIDSDMSARQISNQLKKSMQTSRTSRVLLSRFIDEIA